MTVPESITRISGPPYETGAFKPIILNDPEQIIVVQQGHLDIFAVRGSKAMTLARHPFVTRVSAGQAAFGGPELAGNQPEQHGFYFLAVPSRNAVIMETERSRLNDRKAIDINTVVLIDGWIANLSEVLSQNQILPPRDIQLLEADPNVPYPAGQAVGAHHLDVIWVSANQPMQFIGNQDIVIPAKTLFPLSEWTWLHLTADTEISAVHTPALLGSERLCLALDNYSSLLLKSAEYLDEKNAANIQQNSLSNRKEREQVKSTIFWNISQVLNRTPDGKAMTPTSSLPPLLAVASLVARSVGGTMNTPLNGDEETMTADDAGILSTQARLSRIRTREIALAHDWYRRSGPSFIGRSIDEKKPLALISNGYGSYQAVDPEAGRTWPINRGMAKNIERQGVMFYSPLPDRIKAGLKALLHVMSRYGRDIRLLITMATLGGLIALLTPIVTGELLAEIIPRGETEMWVAALGALGLGALGTAVLDIVGAFTALRIEGRTDEQLQASVWGRLVALPTSFFRRFTAGDLADRANGIGMIRQLLTGATVHGLISSVFSIFSLALLFYYSWLLALFACGISLVLIAGSWFLVKRQVRHYRTAFGKQGLIDGFVFQMITGISKLRIANAEYHALALWAEQFAAQRRDTLTARFWGGGQHTVNAIFMPLSLVVLFTFIWYSLIEGGAQESFDLADFLSFNAAFGQFAASIVGLTGAWTTISSAVPLFEGSSQFLNAPTRTTLAAMHRQTSPDTLSSRGSRSAICRMRPTRLKTYLFGSSKAIMWHSSARPDRANRPSIACCLDSSALIQEQC